MQELIPPHKRAVELTFEIFNYKKFVKNVLTTFFHRDMMQYIKAKALWNIRSAFCFYPL